MPIRKKIWKNNTGSYTITLPKGWVDDLIKTNGKEPKEVSIEVNGELKIRPVFEAEGPLMTENLSKDETITVSKTWLKEVLKTFEEIKAILRRD